MRRHIEYRTGSKAVYDDFCEKFPEVNLSYGEWREIVFTYNRYFRNYMLDTGERAKMPWGLGSFAISKKRTRRTIMVDGKEYSGLPIDWPKTLKTGKMVYILNTHTDGYRFRWLWFGGARGIPHGDTWFFQASRESSRIVATYLKKPGSRYSQIYREWERNKYTSG
jgi:hypothetical protein